jgi:hypothetical protein
MSMIGDKPRASAALQLALVGLVHSLLLAGCGVSGPAVAPPAILETAVSASPIACPTNTAAPTNFSALRSGPTPGPQDKQSVEVEQVAGTPGGVAQPTPDRALPTYSGPTPNPEEIATREAQLEQVNPPDAPLPGGDVTPGVENAPAPGSETHGQPGNPCP